MYAHDRKWLRCCNVILFIRGIGAQRKIHATSFARIPRQYIPLCRMSYHIFLRFDTQTSPTIYFPFVRVTEENNIISICTGKMHIIDHDIDTRDKHKMLTKDLKTRTASFSIGLKEHVE